MSVPSPTGATGASRGPAVGGSAQRVVHTGSGDRQASDLGSELDVALDVSEQAAEAIRLLAHELRNPLASLQGCARTLLERGDDLPADTRRRFLEVITKQSERMDWLIRAAASFGARDRVGTGELELSEVLMDAAAFAGVTADGSGAGRVVGRRTYLTMAIEAVLFALGDGASARAAEPQVIELHGSTKLLEGPGHWKLDLARQLIEADGAAIEVCAGSDDAVVRLRFAPAGGSP